MLQYFHWYYPADGSLWNKLTKEAGELAARGITALWLPPATKAATGGYSVGYDIYDLFDLGEFNQKGSVPTKYGTKEQYLRAIEAAHQAGIQVYADVVLNHKAGGDETEQVPVVKVNPENRSEVISDQLEIKAFTRFTFPGRKGQYSNFIWDFQCFTGTDYDDASHENGIFRILNEYSKQGWENVPGLENGNYDYLMYTDIDFRNPAVYEEVKHWIRWYYDTIHFDGLRLDAVKHIPHQFFNGWIDYIRSEIKADVFIVGECWTTTDLEMLTFYIEATGERIHLFDSILQFNFHQASRSGSDFNLSTIFNNSLVAIQPHMAVTLVDNHDTQPLQALEAPVEPWFKPLAYALVLLREAGYPCVFYPDLYGASYQDKGPDGNEHTIDLAICGELETLLWLRKEIAYGTQRDYLDHPNCIGWTREGIDEKKGSGCAVVLSNGEAGEKHMEIGKQHTGKKFMDVLRKRSEAVVIDENGWGNFFSNPGSVSVWIVENMEHP